MPAHATANNVIASANRLMDVRHDCLSSSRIAEMSVPAWPMPIHQTKLGISNPQPPGMLFPQIPIPLVNRDPIETKSSSVSANAKPKPAYQPNDVFRVRTIELILSVTVLNVCPGAITTGPAA